MTKAQRIGATDKANYTSKITEKQKVFVEELCSTFNHTESYMRAYPNTKNRGTARSEAFKLLRKPHIQAYYDDLREQLRSERIMSAEEVLCRLTAVARGEEKGTIILGEGKGVEGVYKAAPTVIEKAKALELLGKHHQLFTERMKIEGEVAVQIVDDIS